MEIRIGIQDVQRELVVDTDETAEAVAKAVDGAIATGTAFALTDTKGRTVIVPGTKLAYVELGSPTAGTVGFRTT